jgi:replicative DNA helicase
LRGSGSIVQDANIIMLLWKWSERNDIIRVSIQKNRGGMIGDVDLGFDGKVSSFYNTNNH